MSNLSIRKCTGEDVSETAQIYYDAVRQGAAGYYDEAQRAAWAENVPETNRWRDRLLKHQTLVAQLDTRLAGFMTLDAGGHIDLAFVAPDLIGKGVARALYERIEAEALRLGIRRLDTYASYMARRFFELQGWVVVRQQSVEMGDVSLTNFVMEKRLTS